MTRNNIFSASPPPSRPIKYGLLLVLSISILSLTNIGHTASKADEEQSEPSALWSEQWQSVHVAGKKIGHRQIVRSHDKVFTTDEYLTILTKVPGSTVSQSEIHMHYEEDLNARPLLIQKTLHSKRHQRDWVAKIKGEKLLFERWQGEKGKSKKTTQTLKMPKNFLLREGLRIALLNKSQTTPKSFDFNYHAWSFSLGDFEPIQLHIKAYNNTDKPEAAWLMTRHTAPKNSTSHNNENKKENASSYYLNAQFVVLEEYSQVSNQAFAITTCDKACALKNSGALENVYNNLIKSPYRIPDTALDGKIRYQIQLDREISLPSYAEQDVKKRGQNDQAHTYQIDVCARCSNVEAQPPSKAELAHALEANYWMAYETNAFRSVIRSVLGKHYLAPKTVDDSQKALRKLIRFVQKHMPLSKIDYAGYSTATEALASGAGDCTEHALLLATLARAAGIPTRIVFGLAYNNERFYGRRNVFVPHAWIQSWTGERWQSYDSGLEGFTAGHIALKISDGDQHDFVDVTKALAGFSIQSAAQVKQRRSPE